MTARALVTADDFIHAGLIRSDSRDEFEHVRARYSVAITPAMAALVDLDRTDDPIARQFIPSLAELRTHPAERVDPIGDEAKSPVKGIVHRYPDRVLFKIASVCPLYCRFCFRREMVGPANGQSLTSAEIVAAVAYVAKNPAIWEVILTGGDPLILSPRRIAEVTSHLAKIQHLKILRWHTRVPVVAPERVTPDLLRAMTGENKTVYVAIHANHPREITPEASLAISLLANAGITLISQTVLLRGVNDDASTLETLMRAFVELRIKPYYLHHGDLAPGTSHFRVPISEGLAIMVELRRRLSGLALPTYVLDIPGGHGKVPIGPEHVTAYGEGYRVRDRVGHSHIYDDACAPPGS